MRPYPYQRVHGAGPGRREQGIPRAVAVVLLVSALALYLFTSHVLVNRASASISIGKTGTIGHEGAMSVASLRSKHAQIALQRLREMEEADLALRAARGDLNVVQPAVERVAWGGGTKGTASHHVQQGQHIRALSPEPEGGTGMLGEAEAKEEEMVDRKAAAAAEATAAGDDSALSRGVNLKAHGAREDVMDNLMDAAGAEKHEAAATGEKKPPLPLLLTEDEAHVHNDEAEEAEHHEVRGAEGDGDVMLALLPEDKAEEQRHKQEGEALEAVGHAIDGGDPLPMVPEDDHEEHEQEEEEEHIKHASGEQRPQGMQGALETNHDHEIVEKGSARDGRGSSGGHNSRDEAGDEDEGHVLLPEDEEDGDVGEGKAVIGAKSGLESLSGRISGVSGSGYPASAGLESGSGGTQRYRATKREGAAASESIVSYSAPSGAGPDEPAAAWEPQHLNTQLLDAQAAARGQRLRAVTPQTLMSLARATDAKRPWELGAAAPRLSCREGSDCPPGKLCVDDRCKCPVMYSGDANCTSHTVVQMPWCLLPSSNPKAVAAFKSKRPVDIGLLEGKRDLVARARWDSCAVVGTSDSLTDSAGLGPTIDEATAVIRLGDAPTKGYEEFVGSKTTLRVQRKEKCGFSESPQEMCLIFDSLSVPRGSDGRPKCPSRKSSSCELLVASRRMISYGKAYWRFAGAPMAIGSQAEGSGGLRGTLSADMYAVALAMHICGKVQVYGLALSPDEAVYWQGGADVDMGGHAEQMEQRCHQVLRSGLYPRVTVV